MAASLLIAFDGSAAAEAAVRAAAALFPGARATVLTIHEPAVGPVTAFRAGGALMSPELVEQNVAELERELVGEAKAAAAEGARLAEAVGLVAEPAVAPGERQPWEPILAAAAERGADVVVCGTRGRGRGGPLGARLNLLEPAASCRASRAHRPGGGSAARRSGADRLRRVAGRARGDRGGGAAAAGAARRSWSTRGSRRCATR